jgi:hypothetical protein
MENSFLQKLDKLADRMPRPEFTEVSPNSRMTFTLNQSQPIALTISWQWALAKIGEALMAGDATEIIHLLFLKLDYIQIHQNALSDISSIIRKQFDINAIISTQAKIDSFKDLMSEYLHQTRTNQPRLDYLINESSLVLDQIKSLEVMGLGAFMIASGLHLVLLQEQASSDGLNRNYVKSMAIEHSQYAARVSPKLFKLSVGLIDKECSCTKCKSEPEVQEEITYECSYFDGKNIHIFRDFSPNAVAECNKHRLQMFQNVVSSVNETAVKPVRLAIKNWRQLAASI